jgi:hypothetical protein
LTSRTLAIAALALTGCAPLLLAQVQSQHAIPSRHRHARPRVTGIDGTQTNTAKFLGNATTISTSSGALALARQPNCSLGLATGNYAITDSGVTYTQTDITPHYEQVLHSEAGLTTTADVFASGCLQQPPPGYGSRPGVFVGTTTAGVKVYAGIGYINALQVNGVYLLTGTTTFTLTSFQFSTVGALTSGDLNKDGNGDLVILDTQGASTARVTVMLGKADGTFPTSVAYPIAGNYSVAAVIDDVNGDGNPDIVAVSGDQQISVLLGNGDGTFQAAKSFAASALPGYTSSSSTPIVNMITADLRGIGKKDLICANGLVLLGNGDGTFTAVAAPAFPYFFDPLYSDGPSISAADVNKDGRIDLVMNNSFAISTWLGKGDGTFTQGLTYANIGSDGIISVDDLDGDGNPDIFVGLGEPGDYGGDEGSPNLAYGLMGNGDGSFQGAPQIEFGAYNGNNLADVTGSGTLDLITNTVDTPYGYPYTGVGTFTVQMGTGKGTFTPGSTITAPASFTLNGYTVTGADTAIASTFAVADINGDGKADLVFADNGINQNSLPIYFTSISNGDGTFQTPVPFAFPQIAPGVDFDISLSIDSLEITNFSKGGKPGLLFTYNEIAGIGTGGPAFNPYNQGIIALPGNGDGTFKAPVITSTYSSATAPYSAIPLEIAAVADLNGDGNPDLLINIPGTSVVDFQLQTQLALFLGNGDGSFQAPVNINTTADVYGTPVVADLNKDGKLDLALLTETSAGQAQLVILFGNGDGTFGAPNVFALEGGDVIRGASLVAADFNGDGNLDLALFEQEAFSGIFYGNGDGTFNSVNVGTVGQPIIIPQDLVNLSAFGPAFAADFASSGRPDILVGNTMLINEYVAATAPTASSTALAASSQTITAGASVTFTATVTGPQGNATTPTGTVTFFNGTTQLSPGTLNSSGVATYTTTALPVGSDSITAVYGGDTNFTGSTSAAVVVTVNAAAPAASSTALSASTQTITMGASVTFTATVTGPQGDATIPTGTVTFFNGTTQLGPGTLNSSGVATYTTTALPAGSDSITAVYGGDANFAGSTSSAVVITVNAAVPPSYALTNSGNITINPGATSANTSTISVTGSGGFTGAVALTCAVTPTAASDPATCALAPASVTISNATAQTSTLTITSTAATTGSLAKPHGVPWYATTSATLACLLLFGIPMCNRNRRRMLGVILLLAIGCIVASCGGGGGGGGGGGQGNPGTSAGTYSVTVTGTSGTTTETTAVTLTVN